MSNIIAIVGRPNVGKSTLFNRLTESRDAIVKEVSGVTRDRIYGKGEWNGYKFSVIDTGGYAATKEDIFEGEIRKQVELAIDEAKVILFMVDVMTGIVEMDLLVAELLRKSKKKILVVANKVDTNDRIGMSAEFYSFGLGDVFDLSAANGGGTGDLLDEVVTFLDKDDDAILEQDPVARVAAETLTSTNLVVLGGEITTTAKVDYEQVVRDTLEFIGYDNIEYGIDYKTFFRKSFRNKKLIFLTFIFLYPILILIYYQRGIWFRFQLLHRVHQAGHRST